MTITAWVLDESKVAEDQRNPGHTDPIQWVPMEVVHKLGVLSWSDLTGPEDPRLEVVKTERGYNYTDVVNVSEGKLPGYHEKLSSFFTEHIHYDEEIRYCMEGSGYFDVRGFNDEWIRIQLQAGDMIVLPEGIFHRFTPDGGNAILAMRLFVGEPVWTPHNRDDIDAAKDASRLKYINQVLGGAAPATASA
jgi:1,2-dihydroxy-3-keto-5-methylthiopentene dioxygenase